MTVPVDIYVQDDAPVPSPIVGASVLLLDAGSLVIMGQGQTNDSGMAALVVAGTTSPGRLYEVRAFKQGVLFANPFNLRVQEPVVDQNIFTLSGTWVDDFGLSQDPRICRCSTRLVDFSNQPLGNKLVRIAAQGETTARAPKIVDGHLVSAALMDFHTDASGYITMDLLRGGEYLAIFAGEEDETWNFKVPDRSTANFIDLVHPYPVYHSWDQSVAPGNTVSLAVGESKEVPLTVLFSDFQTYAENLGRWIWAESTNPSICALSASYPNATLTVTGVTSGSASIRIDVAPNLYPRRIPDYAIQGPSLTVTVI